MAQLAKQLCVLLLGPSSCNPVGKIPHIEGFASCRDEEQGTNLGDREGCPPALRTLLQEKSQASTQGSKQSLPTVCAQ